MELLTIPLDDIVVYEKGVSGSELIKDYGTEFGQIMFDYNQTSDPIVFDKNKDLIKKVYENYQNLSGEEQRYASRLLYKIRKIIFLTDEFKRRKQWKNPIVCRSRGSNPALSIGFDRYHVMKSLNVKQYEVLVLSNIEFSLDFVPKLKTFFEPDTVFRHWYDKDKKRYKFEVIHKIQESPQFNIETWLNTPYIENCPSAIIAQPNRVSLRDAAISRLKKGR